MKTIPLFLASIIFSTSVSALTCQDDYQNFMTKVDGLTPTKVIPYDPINCMKEIEQVFKLYTKGTLVVNKGSSVVTYDIDAMMTFMKNFISEIEGSFAEAGDVMTLRNLNPVCIAVFDDSENMNAKAIGNDNIIFGLDLIHDLQASWNIDGETGIKAILAHEYAHLIQNRKELPFNLPLPNLATKVKELQADCLAGALLTFHSPKGNNLTEPDKLMGFLGDHNCVGDHGTYEERKKAIYTGMQESLKFMLNNKTKNTLTSNDFVEACSKNYPSYK
jgi:hypothetical protein